MRFTSTHALHNMALCKRLNCTLTIRRRSGRSGRRMEPTIASQTALRFRNPAASAHIPVQRSHVVLRWLHFTTVCYTRDAIDVNILTAYYVYFNGIDKKKFYFTSKEKLRSCLMGDESNFMDSFGEHLSRYDRLSLRNIRNSVSWTHSRLAKSRIA